MIMKSQFTPLYFLLLLSIFLVSNSANPPDGRTGAPEDGACTNCHTGNNPNSFDGTLEILGLPDELIPNTTYELAVRMSKTSGNPVRAGFQMVALDANNANAGTFSNAGPSSSIKNSDGRTYFGHRPALRFEDQEAVSWTTEWTAPATGGTDITFYANSIFGNGNSSGGDFNLPITLTRPVRAGAQAISVQVSSTNVTCAGGNDGSLALTVTGGTGNPSYQWSNGSQEVSIDNLTAGEYMVTISDEGASNITTTFNISEPPPIQIAIRELVHIDCNNPTGSATVEATGGITGYAYRWGNGEGTTISLEEGTHEVTVTDGSGCTQTASVTIEENIALPDVNAGPSKALDCKGPVTELEGAGSQGDEFTYLWTTSMGNIISGETTLTPTIEAGGIYTLLVSNTATGCSASSQVEIMEDKVDPIANAGTVKQLNCSEDNASLNGEGSSTGEEFEYEWITEDGNITSGRNTLRPSVSQVGSYTLWVTNTVNGCFSAATVEVIQDTNMPTAFAGAAKTLDCNTTQVTLTGNGSTGIDFIYSWETEDGKIESGENTLNPVVSAPGTYRLTVRNRTNGCDASSSVVVSGQVVTAIARGNVELSCNANLVTTLHGEESSSGSAIVYNWTTEDGNILSDPSVSIINVDRPGTYKLKVSDIETGCEDEDEINVTLVTAAPSLNVVERAEISCDNPTISLQVTTSDDLENLSIQWQSVDGNILEGANSLTPIVNAPGTYNLGVFDNTTSCATTAVVVVTKSEDAVAVEITNTEDGTGATATANGGIAPYSYEWNTMPISTTATISNIPNGEYSVTVTDANGCSSMATTSITGTTSIPTISSLTSMTLYPNPTIANFQLDVIFNRKEVGTILIFNSLGEQLWQQAFDTNTIQTRIETKQWEGGVYYLMLQTDEGVKAELIVIND